MCKKSVMNNNNRRIVCLKGRKSNTTIGVFWILGKGFVMRLIKCTLGSGKPKEGREFGVEGTREQWGTKGSSLQATWDRGGRFLSQLEGAK